MRGSIEAVVSCVMLTEFLWVIGYLLPRARRERDIGGIVGVSVAAALALFGWLLMGTGVR